MGTAENVVAATRSPLDQLRPRVRRVAATPLVPVAIAIVLGLFRSGEKSLWLDEAVSIAIARLPTAELVPFLFRIEMHAAPYYLSLHPWLALGEGEAVVRALSIVFGAVAVVATWAIGRRYGVAFSAALILSVSPIFVEYLQETRGYTLLMATSAVATLLFLRLADRMDRWRVATYVVVAGALIYVHPLGALVVAAHAVAVLMLKPPSEWPKRLAVYVAVGVLWLPMLRFMLLNRDRIAWIPELTPEIALEGFFALGGGPLTAAFLAPLIVLGLRRDALLPWLLVPIVGTVVISLLVQPVFQVRYLLSALPAAAVIAARNRAALVALLVAVSLVGVWGWYERGPREEWRALATWVSAQAQPEDGIVFAPAYLRFPFGYYARVGTPLYPPEPWSASLIGRAEPDTVALGAHSRIWVIDGHGSHLPPAVAAELASRDALIERHFGALTATLLVDGDDPATR